MVISSLLLYFSTLLLILLAFLVNTGIMVVQGVGDATAAFQLCYRARYHPALDDSQCPGWLRMVVQCRA